MFLAAAGSANVADGVRSVALPLLAVALTRHPVLVAGLGVAQSLPFLLAGLPAGVAADRVDRRRLLIATNAVEAALFAGVVAAVLLDAATVWLLYGVAFCLGSNETVRDTTMSTAVPALVTPEGLERANGRLVTVGFVGNQLAGPALGAALFALAMTAPFALAVALTVSAAALIATLPTLNRTVPGGAPNHPGRGVNCSFTNRAARLGAEVAEGIRFLGGHRVLRTIALLAVVLSFTHMAWFSILILLLTDELGLPESAYGLVLAVAAGGGAAGGWVAHRIITRLGAATILRGGVVLIGSAQVAIGLTHSVIVATIALTAGNAGFAVWLTAAASQRHALTPDRLLGRVTAAWRTAALGAIPLGALTGGFTAQALGLRAPFVAGAPLLYAAALLARPLTTRSLAAARAAEPPQPPASGS